MFQSELYIPRRMFCHDPNVQYVQRCPHNIFNKIILLIISKFNSDRENLFETGSVIIDFVCKDL